MAEKTENFCEISLNPPNKIVSSIVCRLKISNCFTLAKHVDSFNVYSPVFEFANTTWRFRFSSEEDHDDDEIFKICIVHLLRVNFEMSEQRIFSTIILLDAYDKIYSRVDEICEFDGDDDKEIRMGSFYNSEPSYDRRDTLSLIINLISAETEFHDADQMPFTSLKGTSISQDFKDVLLNGEDFNLTFNVCGKQFKAHRDILKARSEVFHSMLSHNMLEKNNNIINIPDCNPKAFEQFLFYIYTGEIKALDELNVFDLYYTADKYNFAHLKQNCCEFIKNVISVTNIPYVIDLASKHSDADLLDCALSYFNHNADVIWPSAEWQSFMKEKYILANEFIAKSFKMSKDRRAKRLKTS